MVSGCQVLSCTWHGMASPVVTGGGAWEGEMVLRPHSSPGFQEESRVREPRGLQRVSTRRGGQRTRQLPRPRLQVRVVQRSYSPHGSPVPPPARPPTCPDDL